MPKNPARRLQRSKSVNYLTAVLTLSVTVILSVVGLGGAFLYKNVTKNLVSAFSSDSSYPLEKDIYTSLLVKVDDLNTRPLIITDAYYYIYDIDSKSLNEYVLDVHTPLDMPGNRPEEELAKSLALGMLEKDSNVSAGIQNLRNTLKKQFAYKVDRVILTDSDKTADIRQLLSQGSYSGFMNLSTLEDFKDHIQTDISLNETINIVNFANSLPAERIYSKKVDKALLLNKEALSEEIRNITFDSGAAIEKKAVSIVNGAQVSGLAAFGSRVVENLGARAVSVENSEDTYAKSMLICDDIYSKTCRELSHFFGILVPVSKDKAPEMKKLDIVRPDVVLVLGLDTVGAVY